MKWNLTLGIKKILVMLLTTLEKPEFYSKKEWCSNRLKLIMLWQAIGRTGEVALSSWNDAHWNEQIDNLQTCCFVDVVRVVLLSMHLSHGCIATCNNRRIVLLVQPRVNVVYLYYNQRET